MRDVLDLGGVLVLRVHDIAELQRADVDAYDCVYVRNQRVEGGIYASPRVEWFMSVTAPTLCERFVGNHRRKLKRTYEASEKLGMSYEWVSHVNEEQYVEFLTMYRAIVGSKEHARILLDEQSVHALRTHPLHAVRIMHNGRYIGGSLVRDYGEYYAVSYSAYPQFSRDVLESGVGVPVFDVVYQRSIQDGRSRVSYGMDTNLYGFHLNIGLLEYKLSIGCTPSPKERDGDEDGTLFILREPAQRICAWYEPVSHQELALCVASSVEQGELHKRFSHSAHARVYPLVEYIQGHRKVLTTVCGSV